MFQSDHCTIATAFPGRTITTPVPVSAFDLSSTTETAVSSWSGNIAKSRTARNRALDINGRVIFVCTLNSGAPLKYLRINPLYGSKTQIRRWTVVQKSSNCWNLKSLRLYLMPSKPKSEPSPKPSKLLAPSQRSKWTAFSGLAIVAPVPVSASDLSGTTEIAVPSWSGSIGKSKTARNRALLMKSRVIWILTLRSATRVPIPNASSRLWSFVGIW